jgi:thioredoxin-like negative regulator of GroEL
MEAEGSSATVKRQIDVFSAGCATCNEAIQTVLTLAAAEGHEVRIHDMHNESIARRAKELGIRSIPAVAVVAPGQHAAPGQFAPLHATKLAACCANRGPEEAAIREALASQ